MRFRPARAQTAKRTAKAVRFAVGGDCWTRTSDLLRVKMRRGQKERAVPSFPPLLAQNHLLSAPLFPLPTACSDSSLGHGLGQAPK